MFPLGGFFLIDPLPDWRFHPIGKFGVGYNSMIYNFKDSRVDTASANLADSSLSKKDPSGYYYGIILRAGADCVFSLGESTGLFAGAEYQWANTRSTAKTGNNEFLRRDMSGLLIRVGFRAAY